VVKLKVQGRTVVRQEMCDNFQTKGHTNFTRGRNNEHLEWYKQ